MKSCRLLDLLTKILLNKHQKVLLEFQQDNVIDLNSDDLDLPQNSIGDNYF